MGTEQRRTVWKIGELHEDSLSASDIQRPSNGPLSSAVNCNSYNGFTECKEMASIVGIRASDESDMAELHMIKSIMCSVALLHSRSESIGDQKGTYLSPNHRIGTRKKCEGHGPHSKLDWVG